MRRHHCNIPHRAQQLLQRMQGSAPTFATSGFASVSVAALTTVWMACLFCTLLQPSQYVQPTF